MARQLLKSMVKASILGAFFMSIFMGCSCDSEEKKKSSGSSSAPGEPAPDESTPPVVASNDFANSSVVFSRIGLADGSTPLVVSVRLVNSDNSVVSGFTPSYDVLSGTVGSASACTASDGTGISYCVLSSSTPGTIRIGFSNIKITLEHDLVFAAVTSGSAFGSEAAGLSNQVGGSGYSLSAAAGSVESDLVKVSSGNWKLFGGLRAGAISE